MSNIDDWINRVEGEVDLIGEDGSNILELDFPAETKKYRLLQIRVVRESVQGTVYDVNSFSIQLYDQNPDAVHDKMSMFFSRSGKEPDTDGVTINETQVTFGTVVFATRDASGKLYAVLSRSGGKSTNGRSEETYKVLVDALRHN